MLLLLLACGTPEVTCTDDEYEIDGFCYRNGGDTPHMHDTGDTTTAALPDCDGDLWDARGDALSAACLACAGDVCTWTVYADDTVAAVELDLAGAVGDDTAYAEFHDAFQAVDGGWAIQLSLTEDPTAYASNVTTVFEPGDPYAVEVTAFDAEGALDDCFSSEGADGCRTATAAR